MPLPENFDAYIQTALQEVCAKAETIATRKASQNSIEILAKALPELVDGSADLTPSNLTDWSNSVSVTREKGGNYIHYDVLNYAEALNMPYEQFHRVALGAAYTLPVLKKSVTLPREK